MYIHNTDIVWVAPEVNTEIMKLTVPSDKVSQRQYLLHGINTPKPKKKPMVVQYSCVLMVDENNIRNM
jgi:hypothetical protein